MGVGGCAWPDQARQIEQLQQQNEQLRQQVESLQRQLTDNQQLLDAQAQRIRTLLRLGPKRLERLYWPVRLEIDALSGGYDADGKGGDDGVEVYLRPVDQDGHAITAAGQIRVELYDLANPDGQHLVGRRSLDPDQARRAWFGRFWTHHYTVKCPWLAGKRPTHRQITIRATFIDYLTGRTLRAQRVCTVKLAPASQATDD
ncbi:MAG: hypothetical protein ACE5K7_02060 [Phycisphaerae bacterium]